MENTPKKIIVHHSASTIAGDQFTLINSWHKERNFPLGSHGLYVGYHYVIEKSGEIKQAREEEEEGAHAVGQNRQSIGICLAGNFDVERPTKAQEYSLCWLLGDIFARRPIKMSEIWPHRAFANKSCFGYNLPMWWARDLYAAYHADRLRQLVMQLRKLVEKLSNIAHGR